MKKLIVLGLCFGILMQTQVSAGYITGKKPDTNQVTISGELESAKRNKLVHIIVAKKGYDINAYPDGTIYTGVAETEENGVFSEDCTLDLDNVLDEETDFTLYLSGYDSNEIYHEDFKYYKSSAINGIISQIAGYSDSEYDLVKTKIENNLEPLNITNKYFIDMLPNDKEKIYKEIAKETQFSKVLDFENVFYSCVAAVVLGNVDSGEEAKHVLEELKEHIKLEELPIYDEFSDLGTDSSLVYDRMYGKGTLNRENICDVFLEQTVCVKLSKTKNAADVKTLFEKAGGKLADTYNSIENCKYPGNVYTELIGTEVSDFDALKDKVKQLIAQKGSPMKPSTNGGGGSSSGSGIVSSGAVMSYPVNQSTNTEVKEQSLSDLKEANWAEASIKQLHNKNIITGYPDGTFRPNESMTREQFAAIIFRAFDIEKSDSDVFTDVPADAWYKDAVNSLAEKGIINGVADGYFGVGLMITRQDAATILMRVINNKEIIANASANIVFVDKQDISSYATEAIHALSGIGIINGYPDGSFRPFENMTRAQCCVMLHRLMEKGVN